MTKTKGKVLKVKEFENWAFLQKLRSGSETIFTEVGSTPEADMWVPGAHMSVTGSKRKKGGVFIVPKGSRTRVRSVRAGNKDQSGCVAVVV